MPTFNVQAIFSMTDRLSGPAKAMAGSLRAVDSSLSRVAGLVGTLGAAAGTAFAGFQIGSLIHEADRWYEQVEKMNREIGVTAEEASGLMGAFSLTESGVQALTGHTRMWAMNMKGLTDLTEEMALSMEKASKKNPWLQLKDKSAVGSLLEIADKVQKSTDPLLTAAKYYRRGIAMEMLPALKMGRAGLQELMKEAEHAGVVVTEKSLGMFANFKDARRQLSLSWTGLKLQIATELFPLLRGMIDWTVPRVRGMFESIKPGVTWFRDHMDQVLKIVKGITYYMAINKGLMMMTGRGAIGNIGRAAGFIAAPLTNAMGFAGGGLWSVLNIIRGIISSVGRLTIVGTVIFAVIEGVIAVKNNVLGLKDRIVQGWEDVKNSWGELGHRITTLIDNVFGFGSASAAGSVLENVWKTFGTIIPELVIGLEKLTSAIGDFLSWVTAVLGAEIARVKALFTPGADSAKAARDAYRASEEAGASYRMNLLQEKMAKAAYAAGTSEAEALGGLAGMHGFGGSTDIADLLRKEKRRNKDIQRSTQLKGQSPYMDFRNSTFHVEQKFEHGDMDRAAVVFTEDLQKLAEDRISSSAVPFVFGRM